MVDTLAHAAGRRQRAPRRLGIRALAVAALTAALVAVGATGWAVIAWLASLHFAFTARNSIVAEFAIRQASVAGALYLQVKVQI